VLVESTRKERYYQAVMRALTERGHSSRDRFRPLADPRLQNSYYGGLKRALRGCANAWGVATRLNPEPEKKNPGQSRGSYRTSVY